MNKTLEQHLIEQKKVGFKLRQVIELEKQKDPRYFLKWLIEQGKKANELYFKKYGRITTNE